MPSQTLSLHNSNRKRSWSNLKICTGPPRLPGVKAYRPCAASLISRHLCDLIMFSSCASAVRLLLSAVKQPRPFSLRAGPPNFVFRLQCFQEMIKPPGVGHWPVVSHGMQDVLWKLMSQPRRPGRGAGLGQGQRRRASSLGSAAASTCFVREAFSSLLLSVGAGHARPSVSSGHRTQHKAYPEANAHLD